MLSLYSNIDKFKLFQLLHLFVRINSNVLTAELTSDRLTLTCSAELTSDRSALTCSVAVDKVLIQQLEYTQ